MAIDPFGYDNSVNQINSIRTRDQDMQDSVNDWNNKIQQEYNQAKGDETLTDDASYVKDIMGNIMGASGLNSAYKNRQATLVDQAKTKLASLTDDDSGGASTTPSAEPPAEPVEVAFDGNAPSIQLSGGLDDAGYGGSIHPTGELPPSVKPPNTDWMTGGSTEASPPVASGEPTLGLRNGGTSGEVSSLEKTIAGDTRASTTGDSTLMGTALNKISRGALGEEAAETIGKWGGAITNGTIGGIDLVDGVDNWVHGKSFYNKDQSGLDDFSKDMQIAAGVSDMVGLIPGLEWVAALGNVAGLSGAVAGMFGDHKKNVQHDNNVEAMQGNLKTAPSQAAPIIAAGVSQSTLRAQ